MTVRNPTSQENQGTTPQAERPTLTIANFQYSCALCGPNMTYPCEHWLSYLNAGRAVAPVETRDAKGKVCAEIQDIMRVYREQEASAYGVDTPGGLEHMGDVWSLLARWDRELGEK